MRVTLKNITKHLKFTLIENFQPLLVAKDVTVWPALPQSNTKHTVKLMFFGHSKSLMETKGSLGLLQMTVMLSVKHGVEIFSV